MTRKDYVALAEALRVVHPDRYKYLSNLETWQRAVATIADVLAADNPRFERDRFIKACEGAR